MFVSSFDSTSLFLVCNVTDSDDTIAMRDFVVEEMKFELGVLSCKWNSKQTVAVLAGKICNCTYAYIDSNGTSADLLT